jgi:hypothetical protein
VGHDARRNRRACGHAAGGVCAVGGVRWIDRERGLRPQSLRTGKIEVPGPGRARAGASRGAIGVAGGGIASKIRK